MVRPYKYTDEFLLDVASHYKDLKSFRESHPALDNIMKRRGLERPPSKAKRWTDEDLIRLCKGYDRRIDLRRAFPGAYATIHIRGLQEHLPPRSGNGGRKIYSDDFLIQMVEQVGRQELLATEPGLLSAFYQRKLHKRKKEDEDKL